MVATRRVYSKFAISLFIVAALHACGAPDNNRGRTRRFVAERWDTIALIAGHVTDTALLRPARVVLWDSRLAVLDADPPFIRVFNDRGESAWTFGGRGEGPGEFATPWSLTISPDTTLLIWDPGLRRIIELGQDGSLIRQTVLLARQGPSATVVGDKLVMSVATDPDSATVVLDARTFETVSVSRLPWPDTLPPRTNINRWIAPIPGRNAWVSAFYWGPGFFVHRDTSAVFHRWIEPVDFWVGRVDTLKFAASSADVFGDEAYFLFGGRRPPRGPEDQTDIVDVYGLDGEYKRSYRLPGPAVSLTTDGKRFFVLQHDPAPALLIIRPIPGRQ